MFIVLELGTGFCYTYKQFLACRALFGIAMGGIYGNAVATALEDCPIKARGIISGILQNGYIVGYMFATVFARALVGTTSHGWRPLFWFGACPPVLIIAWRLCLPETDAYQNRERIRKANKESMKSFFSEAKESVKLHWLLLFYMFLLLAGLNVSIPKFSSTAVSTIEMVVGGADGAVAHDLLQGEFPLTPSTVPDTWYTRSCKCSEASTRGCESRPTPYSLFAVSHHVEKSERLHAQSGYSYNGCF